MAARTATPEMGHLSFLAGLIEPFASDRAERIAAQIISEFGGLGNALEATPQRLSAALSDDGDVLALFVAARRLVQAGLRECIIGAPIEVGSVRLHEYLRSLVGNSAEERCVVVYLGWNNHYIFDEIVGTGSLANVKVCTRRIVRRALDLGARGLLLAHNHPSGDCRPSVKDIANTKALEATAQALDIVLVDHLIVTRSSTFSIRHERSL